MSNLPAEQDILSKIIIHNKYAKYLPELKRRETWGEIVTRNKDMHIGKFEAEQYKLTSEDLEDFNKAYELVYEKKVLPSLRSMQFGGKPVEINNVRMYNCSYLPIDDWKAFHEIMFLLLSGAGVGIGVQKHQVEKLPEIIIPTKERRFLIGDSSEGWADAVQVLMKSYLGITNNRPNFDFRSIRPKGQALITSGGVAPGPEPLQECLFQIEKVLKRKKNGEKLTPLEVHDIICHIADAVLSGGIRRAAIISLFSVTDLEMLYCKTGSWYEENPQRGRANNSIVFVRHRITREKFNEIWKIIKASNSGEPGIIFTNDKDSGVNPCAEVMLRPFSFCNLTEINASTIESQTELNERVKAATIIGTIQATYTNFHYLRDIWKINTEKDALLGVSLTGIASGTLDSLNLKEATDICKKTNEEWAKKLRIKQAARLTTVKPSGTASIVLGTSSGIHAWHNDYYMRRVRLGKTEDIYKYLKKTNPELLEDDVSKPHLQAILSIPQKAPEGAVLRNESVMNFLERIKKYNIEWVRAGYRKGANNNNVSATVSVKEDEWDFVGNWMWENKEYFNGLSVLPFSGGSYVQAPFTDCTKEKYEEMLKLIKDIHLQDIVERIDNTKFVEEAACSGPNGCEVTFV